MAIVYKEYDPLTGTNTKVHDVDGKITIQKSFDGELFKKMAKQHRDRTEGEKWGEMRYVGTIPPAELGTMLRQDGRIDQKRVRQYFQNNPDLVAFSRYIK